MKTKEKNLTMYPGGPGGTKQMRKGLWLNKVETSSRGKA
jgi:hypothetical protein